MRLLLSRATRIFHRENYRRSLPWVLSVVVSLILFQNCAKNFSQSTSFSADPQTSGSTSLASQQAAIVAGRGGEVPGSGALGVPTGDAIIARIQNGLEMNAPSTAGNFAKAIPLSRAGLPKVTDPTQASGFDQGQMLIYAACSDLTTGNPSKMQSVYKITPTATIATNQAALIAAGIRMLDQYTGGLASQGPAATQVSTLFLNLVQTLASGSGNTSTIAFMSVCIAANTTGSMMMGF